MASRSAVDGESEVNTFGAEPENFSTNKDPAPSSRLWDHQFRSLPTRPHRFPTSSCTFLQQRVFRPSLRGEPSATSRALDFPPPKKTQELRRKKTPKQQKQTPKTPEANKKNRPTPDGGRRTAYNHSFPRGLRLWYFGDRIACHNLRGEREWGAFGPGCAPSGWRPRSRPAFTDRPRVYPLALLSAFSAVIHTSLSVPPTTRRWRAQGMRIALRRPFDRAFVRAENAPVLTMRSGRRPTRPLHMCRQSGDLYRMSHMFSVSRVVISSDYEL